MKLHLPLSLRHALLLAFSAIAVVPSTLQAVVMHPDVTIQTYTDFGQNKGRYVVGDTNALLEHIRTEEGGAILTYTGGQADYTLEHAMIDFGGIANNGASVAIGYNFIATVSHNGVQAPSFTSNELGENAVTYQGIEYRYSDTFLLKPSNDYKITRLSKIITDVTGSTVYGSQDGDYSGIATEGTLVNQLLYRAGAGLMLRSNSASGEAESVCGPYQYIVGGVTEISAVTVTDASDGAFTTTTFYNYQQNGAGASVGENAPETPLPYQGRGGDSGSPAWVWNANTGQYEYLNALQSGDDVMITYNRGNCSWTAEKMGSFDEKVEVISGATIYLGEIATAGDTISDTWTEDEKPMTADTVLYSGAVTDAEGRELARYNGVQSGLNTWSDLSSLKDTDNWYNYGSSYLDASTIYNQNSTLGYEELFFNENLVLTAKNSGTRDVKLSATVDLGIGYVQFSRSAGEENAEFTVSGVTGSELLNTAGFVVDDAVTVRLNLTNPGNYMREWRKVGGGDLYVEGSGDNGIFLNVGGTGRTILDRDGGYAAYNVLANNGTTVIISDINQIARDFTFGNRGGVLDMNGQSMSWNNGNTTVSSDGFTIHALDEQAVITNGAAQKVTLTWEQGGQHEWLGSFTDSNAGALEFVYNGGTDSRLDMHSIHTQLNHEGSVLTVQSGTLALSGTVTEHAIGSATGTDKAVYRNEDDWHYADTAADIAVESGAVFELGSHARLTGDVTVADGGTYIMREGVKHQMEYIEGGYEKEDTDTISAFFGHKGNTVLEEGATLKVEFSEGSDSTLCYEGNITGAGKVVVATGAGTLLLSGNNMQGCRVELSSAGATLSLNNVQLDSAVSFAGTADGAALSMQDVSLVLGSELWTGLAQTENMGDAYADKKVGLLSLSSFSNLALSGSLSLDATSAPSDWDYDYLAVDLGVDAGELTASLVLDEQEEGLAGVLAAADSSVVIFTLSGGVTTTFGTGTGETSPTNMSIASTDGRDKVIFNLSAGGNFSNNNVSFAGTTQIGTSATTGLILNQGYSSHPDHTFSGKLKGEGVIGRTGSATPPINLFFTGDTTEFSGTIKFSETGGGATTITFGNGQTISDADTPVAGTGTITFGGQNTGDWVKFNYAGTANIGNAITTANSKSSRIELQGSAHMKFTGNAQIGYLKIGESISGITVTTGEIGSVEGASVSLTKTGTGDFSLKNANANFSSVAVNGGRLIMHGTADYTNLGNVTVAKGATFRDNSTNDTTTFHNTITLKGGSDGSVTQATFGAAEGKTSWQAKGFMMEPVLTNSMGFFNIGDGNDVILTDAAVDVASKLYFRQDKLVDSHVTIHKGASLEANSSGIATTLSGDSSISILSGTNGDAVQVTLKKREGATADMTMTQFNLRTVNDGNATTRGAYILHMGDTAVSFTNADMTVTDIVYLEKVTFTNSLVTVKDGAKLVQSSSTDTRVTFDALTLEQGATLTAGNTNNYTFGGATNVTLASLTETSTANSFSTAVLKGKMTESAVLTLNLTNGLLASGGSAYEGDTFSITFSNLLEAEEGNITVGSFVFEGWDVTAATASTSGTTFTLARHVDILSIPAGSASWSSDEEYTLSGGDLVVNTTASIDDVAQAGTITLNGAIDTGSHKLVADGIGTLVLGEGTGVAALQIKDGSTARLEGSGSLAASGGTVDMQAGSTLALNAAQDMVVAGTISGSGAIVKTGSETATLSALSSTWQGSLEVQDGALAIAGDANSITSLSNANGTLLLQSADGSQNYDLTLAAATTEGGTVVAHDITLAGADNTFTMLTATGDVTNGTGTLTLGAGSSVAGSLTMDGNGSLALSSLKDEAPSLTLGGLVVANNTLDLELTMALMDGLALQLGDVRTIATVNTAMNDLLVRLNGVTTVTDSDAFGYSYELQTEVLEGVTQIKLAAIAPGGEWKGLWPTYADSSIDFLGRQPAEVDVAGKVIDGILVDTAHKPADGTEGYTFTGNGTLIVGADGTGGMTIKSGSLSIGAEAGSSDTDAVVVQVNGTTSVKDGGSLTVKDALTTTDLTLEAGAEFANYGTTTVNRTLASSVEVVNEAGATLHAATMTLRSGSSFTNDGTAVVNTLNAAGVTVTNNDALTVNGHATLGTLAGNGALVIGDRATVTVQTDTTFAASALTGSAGTLVMQGADGTAMKLRLAGGAVDAASLKVQAGELTLAGVGNTLGGVTADALWFAGIPSAVEGTPYLDLSTGKLASLGDSLHLRFDNDAALALGDAIHETEQWTLISNVGSSSVADFVLDEELKLYVLKTYNKELNARYDDSTKALVIDIAVFEGNRWDTSDATDSSGAEVTTSGADVYGALDYVTQVTVKGTDTKFDLTEASPELSDEQGLVLMNIGGKEGSVITFEGNLKPTGQLDDKVMLVNSEGLDTDTTRGNGRGAIDARTVLLQVGESGAAAGSVETLQVGAVTLSEAAELVVNNANTNFRVAQLNNEDGTANVEGELTVYGADGRYFGSFGSEDDLSTPENEFATATLNFEDGADQTMLTHERLVVKGTGGQVTLAFSPAGRNRARAGAETVIPGGTVYQIATSGTNVKLDNAADGAVKTLDIRTDSHMVGGTLSFGVRAEDIHNGAAPTITSGANLRLDGTQVVVTQLDSDFEGPRAFDLSRGTTGRELFTLADSTTGSTGVEIVLSGAYFSHYFRNARLAGDGTVVADLVTDHYTRAFARTQTGTAGLSLLDEASLRFGPQAAENRAQHKDLAALLDTLDQYSSTDAQEADALAAAVAGASTATLSSAFAGDMERQLRAIRNRTTTMGVDQTVMNETLPYFNAWINAEGDYRKTGSDGYAPGYELSSWGGTVGFDMDLTEQLTAGLAFTAMYGDLTTDGADLAKGELDTCYVSAFAHVNSGRWVHSFVGSVGRMDASLARTVNYGAGSYRTEGETEGLGIGLMYEVGYTIPMNEDASCRLQPIVNVAWRHIAVDAYDEKGSDAGLSVDEQSYNSVTFGLGARLQAIGGEDVYNRSSLFEMRALLKVDAGDREGEADVAILGNRNSAAVNSAELGAIGAEVGLGLTIPISPESSSLFIDVSAEVRSGSTNANGTVGYRVNF